MGTVTESGLEYEADQRHAEIIARELGLTERSKGVLMPGVSESEEVSKARSGSGEFEDGTQIDCGDSKLHCTGESRYSSRSKGDE